MVLDRSLISKTIVLSLPGRLAVHSLHANPTLGHERGASVPEHHPPVLGLCRASDMITTVFMLIRFLNASCVRHVFVFPATFSLLPRW